MPETILETDDLSAFYGDFQALFGVSVAVSSGEIISVIGANGAGKTTLMRSITGLNTNAPHMVTYRGQQIGATRPDRIAKLGIAMVPEGRQLFQSLTVEENLIIGGQSGRRGPWTLEKINALFPVLEERRNLPATALSGGQQQMVSIGRALMSNPEVLCFDEISLGLAPVIISDIYKALPKIISEGMSAIIVEQDISKALLVSDRVYCLQEGRVSLQGAPHDLTREQISAAYFGV